MKTYKKHYRTSANGIECLFFYKDELSARMAAFYKKNYKDEYQFSKAIFDFETKLIKAGYVKEGETIDYE